MSLQAGDQLRGLEEAVVIALGSNLKGSYGSVQDLLEAALGAMTLMVGDADKRFEAAQAVFQSRDADALPALDQAIAKENDARVRQALAQARAAVVLNLDDASDADKIAAVQTRAADYTFMCGDEILHRVALATILSQIAADSEAPVQQAA